MIKILVCLVLVFLKTHTELLATSENVIMRAPIQSQGSNKIVLSKKRIRIPNFPDAFNPSIIESENGYILTFRYVPNRKTEEWVSRIGVVELNSVFEPCSEAELLETRFDNKKTPSQSEDARIFKYNDKIYVVYNDNTEVIHRSERDRRDMYLAEIFEFDHHYYLSDPVKLVHETDYERVLIQKNWMPFEWQGNLLFSYMIQPHEVLTPDLESGMCKPHHRTNTEKSINWNYGPLRGGTPPCLVDGEYLAFFHSGIITATPSSNNNYLWHYFMGAYTFSAEPPFEIRKISAKPIDSPGFYTKSNFEKRVIYPGGFVVKNTKAYVVYGKDDAEIWIAIIDLNELKKSMVDVKFNN